MPFLVVFQKQPKGSQHFPGVNLTKLKPTVCCHNWLKLMKETRIALLWEGVHENMRNPEAWFQAVYRTGLQLFDETGAFPDKPCLPFKFAGDVFSKAALAVHFQDVILAEPRIEGVVGLVNVMR